MRAISHGHRFAGAGFSALWARARQEGYQMSGTPPQSQADLGGLGLREPSTSVISGLGQHASDDRVPVSPKSPALTINDHLSELRRTLKLTELV